MKKMTSPGGLSKTRLGRLREVMTERIFEPLGMLDTAFSVPESKHDRFATSYRPRNS